MEDDKIIALYWERKEEAITQTSDKYGRYCMKIAYNILADMQDSEECVNDTWLCAWNHIPPERPGCLCAFLGKITRNISLDYYRKKRAKKRGEGEIPYLLDELSECVGTDSVEEHLNLMAVVRVLNRFLEELPAESRVLFVRRYWYADGISDIAAQMKLSESNVKTILFRIRSKLKKCLEQEGISL